MIDPQRLDDILEVLRDRGVSHFSCSDFSVTLTPSTPEADEDIGDAIREAAAIEKLPRVAGGLFGHPALWGGNGPSTFPGSERATPTHTPTHADDEE